MEVALPGQVLDEASGKDPFEDLARLIQQANRPIGRRGTRFSARLWKKDQFGPLSLLGEPPLPETLIENVSQACAQVVQGTDPDPSRYAVRTWSLSWPDPPDAAGKFFRGDQLPLGEFVRPV